MVVSFIFVAKHTIFYWVGDSILKIYRSMAQRLLKTNLL